MGGSEDVVIERYRQRFIRPTRCTNVKFAPVGRPMSWSTRATWRLPRIERTSPNPCHCRTASLSRRLTVADAQSHWSAEDEELARRFGWYPRRSTLEGVRGFLAETEPQWRTRGVRRTWAIRLAETRQLVGGCEARLNGRDSSADVLVDVSSPPRAWPGNPRSAADAGVPTRGDANPRVRAFVERDNLASLGVARKDGFTVVAEDDMNDGRRMMRLELSDSGRCLTGTLPLNRSASSASVGGGWFRATSSGPSFGLVRAYCRDYSELPA